MKTKIDSKLLDLIINQLIDKEFNFWENVYPAKYEQEDLRQELLSRYYQKVYPNLDELADIAERNNHQLSTYVKQKLFTELTKIRKHYISTYRILLNDSLDLVDDLLADEDNEDPNHVAQYSSRPLVSEQPTRADVEVTEQDDLETFTMRLGKIDREILKLFLSGYTEREIAEKTGLSKTSVHNHIAGLHNLAEDMK